MFETIVVAGFWAAVAYAGLGCAFAIAFHIRGISKVDPTAARSGWCFRLIITPGLVVLAPIMMRKWLGSRSNESQAETLPNPAWPRRTRALHRLSIQALCVCAPVLAGAGIAVRQPPATVESASQTRMPQLPSVVHASAVLFSEQQIQAGLRTDGTRFQIELTIAEPLNRPAVSLYWSNDGPDRAAISESVFLGTVWGPDSLRFALPPDYAPGTGSFHLYAALDAEIIASTADPFLPNP